MKMEVPDDVLEAIQAVVVRDCYDTSGDDSWFLVEYLPVIERWLAELGRMPSPPPGLEE